MLVDERQYDGAMDDGIKVRDIAAKVRVFGGVAVEMDAHDLGTLRQAARKPRENAPLLMLARSNPTPGMPPLRALFRRMHSSASSRPRNATG